MDSIFPISQPEIELFFWILSFAWAPAAPKLLQADGVFYTWQALLGGVVQMTFDIAAVYCITYEVHTAAWRSSDDLLSYPLWL